MMILIWSMRPAMAFIHVQHCFSYNYVNKATFPSTRDSTECSQMLCQVHAPQSTLNPHQLAIGVLVKDRQ